MNYGPLFRERKLPPPEKESAGNHMVIVSGLVMEKERRQHKLILEEVLKNKSALSLIGSTSMKTYILGELIEDLKRR